MPVVMVFKRLVNKKVHEQLVLGTVQRLSCDSLVFVYEVYFPHEHQPPPPPKKKKTRQLANNDCDYFADSADELCEFWGF